MSGAVFRRTHFFLPVLVFCLIPLILAGCDTARFTGQPRQELSETTYAATDRLAQQAKGTVTVNTPLQVGALTDIENPGEETAFGQMLARQVGARFVQLGYSVTEGGAAPLPAMAPAAGAYPADQSMGYGMTGPAQISGQYALAKKEALINLRLIDSSGRVVAAYDYSVPMTTDIKQLARTSAQKQGAFFGLF